MNQKRICRLLTIANNALKKLQKCALKIYSSTTLRNEKKLQR